MKLSRRNFIGGTFAAGACSALGIPSDGRIARIGHMTDTHVVGNIESFSRVRMALELFRAKGVEMIINNGDIADRHIPKAYRLYREVTNEVFPDAAVRPREVFAYAWHDQCGHVGATHADPKDYMAAFENVRKELQASDPVVCDFVWKGLPFIVMSEFTGNPGFPTWEEYEKTIARVCAENPGKPVFVVDHVPPAGTTYHCWFWGNVNCRRILNKFPQVISLSGHVHGSLANECLIWQGEFTAINAGCLQVWDGFLPGSRTNRENNKKSYAVLVMDVFPDRLVAYRHDVRDGSEVGPAWVVPFPFSRASAPYRAGEHEKQFPIPEFAKGTNLSLSAKGNPLEGYELTIPETMTGDGNPPYNFRVRIQRRDTQGEWKTFAYDDVMAEFWKAKKDRDGKLVHFLPSGFFAGEDAYRIAVTPMDFFYREGRVICAEIPSGVKLKTLWESVDPMKEMRYYEGGKPLEPDAAGWVAPQTIHGQFRFPKGALKGAIRSKTNQLLVEIETDQQDGEWHAWGVTLRGGGCGNLSFFQTPVGKSGPLTYVMPFTLPKDKAFTGDCELSFFFRPEIKGNRFAFRRIRLLA
ncbi:MAG: metallophosphoesterase [Kiritimatiellae bacterium]|nr:metallophosphoesterase [Kiritimatiellia bacterium]